MKRKPFVVLILILIIMGSFFYDEIKVKIYPLTRNIQNQKIISNIKGFNKIDTTHFRIYYDHYDPKTIDLVSKAAEEHYNDLAKMFDYYPKKTPVIVYNSSKDLMKNASLLQGKPPMGVYFASTIQILSPKLWVPDHENMEELFMNEGPMVHEFTHLFVDDLAKGNYPLWFTEGIALYEEYVQTGYRWGDDLSFEKSPYTLEQLMNDFDHLDPYIAYKCSFETVEKFVNLYGFDEINRILRALGKGEKFDQFLEKFENL